MESFDNLKIKATKGIIWKLFERLFAQGVSLVVTIVLARLLEPKYFASISIVTIFFTFANVIISSGLNNSLIQKKDSDVIDYSSVLWFSVIIAFVVYVVLFFVAPVISDLYSIPELVAIIRVMSIVLIVDAVKAVFCAYVYSTLQLKKFFVSTAIGTVISAFVGIILAYKGAGAWALVAQQMSNSVIDTIILFFTTKIEIRLIMSIDRLKELLSYGWKIFAASLIGTIYDEISPLIIGLKFKPVDLSYYEKGKSFPSLINSAFNDSVAGVLFSTMAKVQNDQNSVRSITRKFMQMSSFLIFPSMIGFLAVSKIFVKVVLTDKWLDAVIYINIFCVSYMFNIIQNGNLQAIKAIGRSDVILKLEVLKKSVYLAVLILFIIFCKTPIQLAIVSIITSVIATLINTYPNRKLIDYSYMMQIKDILLNLLSSIVMGFIIMCMGSILPENLFGLILRIIIGALAYLFISIIAKNKNLEMFSSIMKNIITN